MRLYGALVVLVVSALVSACGGGSVQPTPPPPATSISVTGLPSEAVAGGSVDVMVRVLDAASGLVTDYRGQVTFSSDDPAAVLPAPYTFTVADAGQHLFTGVSWRTAGARTLHLTGAPSLAGAASTSVVPGPAASLRFTAQPVDGSVRSALGTVGVELVDGYANRQVSATDAVTLALSPAGGGLAGSPSKAAVSGVATFTDLQVVNEGAYTLAASAAGLVGVTSTTFTVTDNISPGTVADLAADLLATTIGSITLRWTAPGDDGPLGDLPAGATYLLKVSTSPITAQNFDAVAGVIATGPPKAVGSAEAAVATGLDAGIGYAFALRVDDGAGNRSFAFAAETTASCPAGYTGPQCQACAGGYVETTPGLCVHVCAAQNPCTAPPADTCTDQVTLSQHPNPGGCAPQAGAPFYACTYTPAPVTCNNGTLCTSSGGAGACTVSPATYQLTGLPATSTAGTSSPVTLSVKDGAGRAYASYRGTAHFTSSDPQALLPADRAFVAGDTAAFTIFPILKTAGSRTFTATDTIASSTTSTQTTTVSAAPADRLAIVQQPTSSDVRSPISPPVTVALTDPWGNRTSLTSTVTAALASSLGGATLAGPLSRAAVAGLATFANLSLDQEGSYTVRFASGSLINATSSTFTVTDNLAPGTPSGFAPSATTGSSVTLGWSAPGDDGGLGNLPGSASYVIKYAVAPAIVTQANFATAPGNVLGLPAPQAVGAPESVSVTGLATSTTYSFGLQVNDGAGNSSYAFTTATTAAAFANLQGAALLAARVGRPAAGELAVTGLMLAPTGDSAEAGQWLELENVSNRPLDLSGLEVSDERAGSGTLRFELARPLLLAPGERIVLGTSLGPDERSATAVHYAWPETFWLREGSTILLRSGGVEVAAVDSADRPARPEAALRHPAD
jgi:hypothetical protein